MCGGLRNCITTLPCACSLPQPISVTLGRAGRNQASVVLGEAPAGRLVILSPHEIPLPGLNCRAGPTMPGAAVVPVSELVIPPVSSRTGSVMCQTPR